MNCRTGHFLRGSFVQVRGVIPCSTRHPGLELDWGQIAQRRCVLALGTGRRQRSPEPVSAIPPARGRKPVAARLKAFCGMDSSDGRPCSPALGFTPRCSCRKTHCQRHSREAFGYFLSRASSNGTGPPPSEEVLPPRLAPDGSSAGIKRPVALPLLSPSCGSTGSEDEACSLGLLCPHNRTSSCRLLALWRGLIARPPSRGGKGEHLIGTLPASLESPHYASASPNSHLPIRRREIVPCALRAIETPHVRGVEFTPDGQKAIVPH